MKFGKKQESMKFKNFRKALCKLEKEFSYIASCEDLLGKGGKADNARRVLQLAGTHLQKLVYQVEEIRSERKESKNLKEANKKGVPAK